MDKPQHEWTEVGASGRTKAPPSNDPNPPRYQWNSKRSNLITDWLARHDGFYLTSSPDENKVLSIDPDSYEGQMLLILQSLFDNSIDAASAASNMLSRIFSAEGDATERYERMIGLVVVKAATHVDSERSLSAMAQMLVHIARSPRSLPRPVNWHRNDDMELKKMPGFGLTFTECMQGPRQYICDFRDMDMTPGIWLTARKRWRNISFFGALVTKEYFDGTLPAGMNLTFRALTTLAEALEHRRDERRTFNAGYESVTTVQHLVWLELPAAVHWIRIAGDAIYALAVRRAEYPSLPAGPLWTATGGSREVTPARWTYWQRRFHHLAEWDDIELALREQCELASERMKAIAS